MNKALIQIQLFLERFAYYSAYAVIILMLILPLEQGGFELESTQRSAFMITMSTIMTFLPIVAGRLCDFVGCRKSQLFALGLNLTGYILLILNAHIASSLHSAPTIFILSMISAILIGLGTGTFYPAAYGKISQSFHHKYLGLGFAIAIILANIAGFLGPIITSGSIDSRTLITGIYIAVGITLINILLTVIFDKSESPSPQAESPEIQERPARSFSYKTILLFLLLITLFFIPVAFQNQILDNYLVDWLPEIKISELIPKDLSASLDLYSPSAYRWIDAILNLIALILLIPLTLILSGSKRRTVLLAGMVLYIVGFIPLCFVRSSFLSVWGILPLLCGNYLLIIKLLEYLAINAPANRKATFMGLYKLPVALSGLLTYIPIYNLFFAKQTLAEKTLMEAGMDTADLNSHQQIHSLSTVLNLPDSEQVTEYLWVHYHPWHIWLILGVIGAVSIVIVSAFLKHHNELDEPSVN